jgi:trehalose 6-phosphate phosphatase
VPVAAALSHALDPLRADPAHSAILLDIDGTLAPIVRHSSDAHVPESTRGLLIEIARRYGLVGCVSGRQATTARQIVAIGTISYVGNHGGEMLAAGTTTTRLDPDLAEWVERVAAFVAQVYRGDLHRLRVRYEDKEAIAAFHWRGAPDEAAAEAAVRRIAEQALAAGFFVHWGRKVLEVRPPVKLDKGRGVRALLDGSGMTAALYVGDDATDVDAFDALHGLVVEGGLAHAVCVAVHSDETPKVLVEQADAMVEGTNGVRGLLETLL